MESVTYTYIDSTDWANAIVDGVEWHIVNLTLDSELARQVNAWIADGNTPAPCDTGRSIENVFG
jgi:hypothetical protein